MKKHRACWETISVIIFNLFFLGACSPYQEEKLKDPTESFPDTPFFISTSEVSSITMTSAVSGGSMTWGGRAPVTSRGVCWNTSVYPTIANSKTTDGTGTFGFTSTLTDLTYDTKYYVRAYATNSFGTAYGYSREFTTLPRTPVVITSPVINFTTSTARIGGNVTSEGSSSVSERGVYWGLSPDPKINGIKISIGTGAGEYLTDLTELIPATTYYFIAYAESSGEKVYGEQLTFTTRTGTLTDADGNIYYTQTIGNQVWMAENLKTTSYSDSTLIPKVNSVSAWGELNLSSRAYCWYDDSLKNKDIYGALYNWSTAMNLASGSSSNPSNVKGVCPTGWHLPSKAEWKELEDFLGGRSNAQGKMKEPGTTHWKSPNTGSTNESGFSALPGGYRGEFGSFGGYDASFGTVGRWWSATESYPPGYTLNDLAYGYSLTNSNEPDFGQGSLKRNGYSVRCVKDK